MSVAMCKLKKDREVIHTDVVSTLTEINSRWTLTVKTKLTLAELQDFFVWVIWFGWLLTLKCLFHWISVQTEAAALPSSAHEYEMYFRYNISYHIFAKHLFYHKYSLMSDSFRFNKSSLNLIKHNQIHVNSLCWYYQKRTGNYIF